MDRNRTNIQLNPVPVQKASEAIYAQIASMILSGQIKPGERLPSERSMMEMLGRSRPTIREALRMLERNGLIKTVPGSRGAIVMRPDLLSVEEPLENLLNLSVISYSELLEYRRLNEVASAGWAAERRTEEDLRRIRSQLEAFSTEQGSFDDFSTLDIAFHQAIAEAGHNKVASMVDKVIHRLVSNILDGAYSKKSEPDRKLMMEQIRASHGILFEAISSGDAATAREAMEEHMRLFEQDVLNEMAAKEDVR